MRLMRARQVLKSLADDTRLRIINLLNKQELNVTDMVSILGTRQSNLSKHLTRLRLTGVVSDRKAGTHVYYYLAKPASRAHRKLVDAIIVGLSESKILESDIKKLKARIKKKRK